MNRNAPAERAQANLCRSPSNPASIDGKRGNMPFGRRIEKRVSLEVPVYLASLREPRPAEKTQTENVSPHGAQILTKRPWQPNEEPLVTAAGGAPQLPVRVVYCRPDSNGWFRIGLEFGGNAVRWIDQSSDNTSHTHFPEKDSLEQRDSTKS